MHRGFVRYWRKIKDWAWFKLPITKVVFLHLVAEANHSNYNFMGFTINRGQVVVGRKKLAFDLGISEDQVRTAINHLKSTSDITVKTTNKFSIVSIANYEIYQGKLPSKIPIKSPDQSPTNPQQIPTIKECKNEKNKDMVSPLEASFQKFWGVYPKKVAKDAALKAFKKLAPDESLLNKIVSSVESFTQTRDWQKEDGQFIPNPATWLNGRRWEDEIAGNVKRDQPIPRFAISADSK
jgi:hypothetical protein